MTAFARWPTSVSATVRLVSRRGNEMKRFGDLSGLIPQELTKVSGAVLDSGLVPLDRSGKPAFYDLNEMRHPGGLRLLVILLILAAFVHHKRRIFPPQKF